MSQPIIIPFTLSSTYIVFELARMTPVQPCTKFQSLISYKGFIQKLPICVIQRWLDLKNAADYQSP